MPKPDESPSQQLSSKKLEELANKRDAFVTAMSTLSTAAQTAARTGYDWFNAVVSATKENEIPGSGESYNAHLIRALSVAPPDLGALLAAPRDSSEESVQDKKKGKSAKHKKEKREKDVDPDEPKKPQSAYIQFIKIARPIIREESGPEVDARGTVAEAGARWREMPREDKLVWEAKHRADMIEYYKALTEYRASKGLPAPKIPEQFMEKETTSAAVAKGADKATENSEASDEEDPEPEASPEPEVKKSKSKVNGTITTAPVITSSPVIGTPELMNGKRKRAPAAKKIAADKDREERALKKSRRTKNKAIDSTAAADSAPAASAEDGDSIVVSGTPAKGPSFNTPPTGSSKKERRKKKSRIED